MLYPSIIIITLEVVLELSSKNTTKTQTLIIYRQKHLLLLKKRNYPLTPPLFTPPHNLSNKIALNDARKVLGVKRNSASREIVLRFKILSRKYYPDEWSHTVSHSKDVFTEKFKTIANARDVILENM